MSAKKIIRLSKVAREFNVGISTIVDFLEAKGHEIDSNPNTKLEEGMYALLVKEYSSDVNLKEKSKEVEIAINKPQSVSLEEPEEKTSAKVEDFEPIKVEKKDLKVLGKIDLEKPSPKKPVEKKVETVEKTEATKEKTKAEKIKPEKLVSNVGKEKAEDLKVVGKVDLDNLNKPKAPTTEKPAATQEKPKTEVKKEEVKTPKKEENDSSFKTNVSKLSGPVVLGKIELKEEVKKPKKKRKRIQKEKVDVNKPNTASGNNADKGNQNKGGKKAFGKKKFDPRRNPIAKQEVSDEDVQKQIRETLAQLTKGKSKSVKHRRSKRDLISQKQDELQKQIEQEKGVVKLTEFVTVSELATMIGVAPTEIISVCMSIGMIVSINQRLDAETISLVAGEFDFEVEFISAEIQEAIEEEEDKAEDLIARPPIVTVMGHVDHGKTSLLDYIRKTNVIAGEAGGITQHIGAYHVEVGDGKQITFLDTPGHEAFTAMRARGAQVTDIAIIIIACDDNVMPQTKEAINHASAAGVPIVFALNKVDKPGADPERIKNELASMNYMTEDWGGKYQSQEISAKTGLNIDELLEKILLEAELLELKANPNKKAKGVVIESSLDKGRGYVTTVLVEGGTLNVGDIMLAGSYTGNVKAMFDERGNKIESIGPAEPAIILGLNGAPTAGDKFNIMNTDKEARAIANKREQLQREQSIRTQKHITLDEIGRRIAVGNFQELNVIVKGDVDGSIEALSDSLEKLSTEEIQLNVIHKAVGQISESDIMLAAASEAIIIGFQVRPSLSARNLAEKEEIDIRLYSIIYDAIEEVKQAMEGMLSPEMKEEIVANLEIIETFKVSKVGTVAGCIVRSGKINRNSDVRIIRDGIVVYTGELGSLKRFKDDVKEVGKGFECGLNINNFNDIKVGDIIEAYETKEVSRSL